MVMPHKFMFMKVLYTLGLSLVLIPVWAQEEEKKHQLILGGYTDVYFATFTDSLGPNVLQQYTTVSPRSERFGLNVVQFSAAYTADQVRGNFIWHYGDIAQATWSEEFPAVQAANVGVRLATHWWIDAGFFATHIGTESFLPKNNYLSATAVATYNEPFYQSGARLSYEGSEQLSGELWVVSGYNFFLDANDAKSIGMLLSYAFAENVSITYTNLFGRESPDGAYPKQFRTYQNLSLKGSVEENWYYTLGGDLGTQTHSSLDSPARTAVMYNALATLRYQWTEEYSLTTRGEIFNDPEGFISGRHTNAQGETTGLQLWGITLGSEYRPAENAYVRCEARFLRTPEDLTIFYHEKPTCRRWEVMLTMGYTFEKLLTF